MDASNVSSFELLSGDFLVTVLSFFVSEFDFEYRKAVVDVQTLRSAMLVSKAWKAAAYSPTSWKIPSGLDNTVQPISERNDEFYTISACLHISDTDHDNTPSLIGFTKRSELSVMPGGHVDCCIVEERVTNCQVELVLRDYMHQRAMDHDDFRAFYACHFLLAENALTSHKLSPSSSIFMDLPQGIAHFGSRLVWWYRPLETPGVLRKTILYPWPDIETRAGLDQFHRWRRALLMDADTATADSMDELSNLRHWIRLEQTTFPGKWNMHGQKPIISRYSWASLVDWILELVQVLNLDIGSAFRAFSYFEIYCNTDPEVGSLQGELQAMAGLCLYLASAWASTRLFLTLQNLFFSADRRHSSERFYELSLSIFCACKKALARPTILDFVKEYVCLIEIEVDSDIYWRIHYLAELALQSCAFDKYPPSMIAASVIILTFTSFNRFDPWPDCLIQGTGYTWTSLEECVVALHRQIQSLSSFDDLEILRRRYLEDDRERTARIQLTPLPLFSTITLRRDQFRSIQIVL